MTQIITETISLLPVFLLLTMLFRRQQVPKSFPYRYSDGLDILVNDAHEDKLLIERKHRRPLC